MKRKDIRVFRVAKLTAMLTIVVYLTVQLLPCLCAYTCLEEGEVTASCCCDKSTSTAETSIASTDNSNGDCCRQCGEKEQYNVETRTVQTSGLAVMAVSDTASLKTLNASVETERGQLVSFRPSTLPTYLRLESFLA